MVDPAAQQRFTEAVVEAMYARDNVARGLAIEIEEVRPRYARMTVREDMLNSHRICHGGVIFTFADSAYAYACNSETALKLGSERVADIVGLVALAELGGLCKPDSIERAVREVSPKRFLDVNLDAVGEGHRMVGALAQA